MKYQEDKETIIRPFVSRQGGSKCVCQIDKNTDEVIAIFPSASKAGQETSSDPSTITKVCKGKMKTTNGFKWRYLEDEK